MFLFPAIDLQAGQVVRLHQGDYDRQKVYANDPVAMAQSFEAAGATWLHLVDLDGAKDGKVSHLKVIQRICQATSLKVEVGGGVRTTQTMDDLLAAGVERVILGTAALRNWDWFRQTVHLPLYHQKIVLGLDARDGKLALQGWLEQTQTQATEVAKTVSDWPLAAIVYTDIATDGTMQGPNVEATRQIAQTTDIPVVASGGVGTLEHLRALKTLPIQGAIIGRSLYEGAFSVKEAIEAFEK